jgi:phosphopantetheinyl transferase (holo-ACP synthase)
MIAVGTDILKIDRIDEVLDRLGDRFVQRILTPAAGETFRCQGGHRQGPGYRYRSRRELAGYPD